MEDKRNQIHRAALAVFAERGFHDTSVAEIAKHAGVAKGTVYLYYDSKADILIDVFRRYLDEILDFVDRLVDSQMTASEILAAFVDRQTTLLRREPNLIRILNRRALQALSDGNEKTVQFNRYLLDRIAALLRRAADRGELWAFDVQIGACVVLAMQDALPLYVTTYGHDNESEAVARASQQLSQFMWASVRKDPQWTQAEGPR